MTDERYKNKLLEIHEAIASGLRADFEASKWRHEEEIRNLKAEIADLKSRMLNNERAKPSDENKNSNSTSLDKVLDKFMKIIGILVAGLLIGVGIKAKL